MAALQAGKHVICEKPPTMNVPEIEAIRHEALQRNLTYFFGRQSRFHPKLLAAKQLVAEGRLGRVYFVKAERIRSRGDAGRHQRVVRGKGEIWGRRDDRHRRACLGCCMVCTGLPAAGVSVRAGEHALP